MIRMNGIKQVGAHTLFLGLLAASMFFSGCSSKPQGVSFDPSEALDHAAKQMITALKSTPGYDKYPRTLDSDGELVTVDAKDWTSGFFPGSLWYLYEYTVEEKWLNWAKAWTETLEEVKYDSSTHDLGFMMYCSFGNGYRLTHDSTYRSILLTTARTLTTRYDENVGCIRSWDFTPKGKNWEYPVIIDNMMNLELLLWAYEQTNDPHFLEVSVNHARNTMKNHYREDYSTYHVVDYAPGDGSVRWQGTFQGLADQSCWARGQAWGLYGFTVMFRETGETEFLDYAKHAAEFILSKNKQLEDGIPIWDYNDPVGEEAPKDASAAAITAAALLELSGHVTGDLADKYKNEAIDILTTLSDHYTTGLGENYGFLLTKSTGHLPGNSEISVPLSYADYYYLEALLKLRSLTGEEASI